ncbi:hypothetical protein [Polyangium fumosum]|uniref:Secreted protein n=1 Tax=Polyangium fumosum TaxID=889272 RepID=A0A4U1IIJ4_9BACT|nr:hypothetical protein [Polyangium fumosum]TKC93658.1 hypothetical protein E8A74_49295 [Polyangium fumosum]
MRKLIRPTLCGTVVAAASLACGPEARAALEVAAGSIGPDGALLLEFREPDVPARRSIRYIVMSRMTAVYVCVTSSGGAVPAMRATVSRHVLEVRPFDSNPAGAVEGTIMTAAPDAPPLACPVNTALTIAAVRYDDISVVSRHGWAAVSPISWEPIPLP